MEARYGQELSPGEEEVIKQQWQPIMGDDYEIVVCSYFYTRFLMTGVWCPATGHTAQ